jgi:hypothetical protein
LLVAALRAFCTLRFAARRCLVVAIVRHTS